MSNFNIQKTEVDKLYTAVTEDSAWMSSWHVKHSFSSPWRVREILKTSRYLPQSVRELETQARRVLPHFISNASTVEWIQQNIHPLAFKLDIIANLEKNLTSQDSWPRRPILWLLIVLLCSIITLITLKIFYFHPTSWTWTHHPLSVVWCHLPSKLHHQKEKNTKCPYIRQQIQGVSLLKMTIIDSPCYTNCSTINLTTCSLIQTPEPEITHCESD